MFRKGKCINELCYFCITQDESLVYGKSPPFLACTRNDQDHIYVCIYMFKCDAQARDYANEENTPDGELVFYMLFESFTMTTIWASEFVSIFV
ncbi:hypothetical protein SUGI_0309310 [Cryptomeria japonica]|nr:hypothetical protein SUGI_0309310 [Cryptomeria japonica]